MVVRRAPETRGQERPRATGYTNSTMQSTGLLTSNQGTRDAFVAKFEEYFDLSTAKYEGRIVWAEQFGTSADDFARAIVIDSDDNLYIAGRTTGSLDEANPNPAVGLGDAFVTKYDKDGDQQAIRQFGGSGDDGTLGVARDRSSGEGLVVSGTTNGSMFGEANAGGVDAFVARIGHDTTDTDGDGLSDYREANGLRGGNGVSVTTDPNNEDTDGDGFYDGEEAGEPRASVYGDYYPMPTNPASADTDGDELGDFDEAEMGLSPTRADTDGDTLFDLVELDENFDPLNKNPDGDSYDDLTEYSQNTDPFHPDRSYLERSLDAPAGFVFGDGGKQAVEDGKLDQETIESLDYLGGWIASGILVFGDVRDLVTTSSRGDWLGAGLSAAGLYPVYGDALKVGKTVEVFVSWTPQAALSTGRWVTVQFSHFPILRSVALKAAGWSDEFLTYLPEEEIAQLARGHNNPTKILEMLKAGEKPLQLDRRVIDDIEGST